MNISVLVSSRPDLRARHGFALVIVLVILSLMAIIAVGYLASMASDRATASAYSNRTRAEQAAQAGVDTAIGTLRDYFKAFPDSATVWDTAQGTNPDGSPSEGTTLYLRAVPQQNNPTLPEPMPGAATDPATYNNADYAYGNNPNNVVPATGADNRQVFVLPLVSGATANLLSNKSNILPACTADTTTTTGNSINLNDRRQAIDTQGWLGSPPGYVNPRSSNLPKPVSVPWVYISQADPNGAGSTPSQIGRYAFWVEDESFRANVNYAALGTNHTRGDNSQNLAINPTNADLLGLFNFISDSAGVGDAQSVYNARLAYPGQLFPDPRAFAHAGEANPADNALAKDTIDKLRYLTTTQSSALNLSRHGTQRLNLNAVVPQTTLPTNTGAVQTQINQIISAIQFHAPNFGQRFYRSSTAPTASVLNDFTVKGDTYNPAPGPAPATQKTGHAWIYLNKVAANIRDYIDPDPVPTIIYSPATQTNSGDGVVRTPGKPSPLLAFDNNGTLGGNEVWAQGKDSAPYIQECATRFRGGPDAGGATYTLYVDYYIEVWNTSTRDVSGSDLGSHPVIRIANPTKWVGDDSTDDPTTKASDPYKNPTNLTCTDAAPANAPPSATRDTVPAGRDYDIDISGVTFKAGVATVITTDPDFKTFADPSSPATLYIPSSEAQNNVKVCDFYPKAGPGKRVYHGPMPTHPGWGTSTTPIRCNCLRMIYGGQTGPNNGATTGSDYETEIILCNDNGIIDCAQGGLPISASGGGRIALPPAFGPSTLPLFGGSLYGNKSAGYSSLTGDPRSNNEQLYYTIYTKSGPPTQSRYFNATATAEFTLGLPDYNYLLPANNTSPYFPWADYYQFPPGPTPNAALSNTNPPIMTAATAPYVIGNAALTSIGQLGDISDPARFVDNGSAVTASTPAAALVNAARGGGRTFKLGQHDDRWDGDVTSASHSWAAWRLADIFSVSDSVDQPGLININGVARDNGAALRAALTGLLFQPAPATPPSLGESQIAGKTLALDVNGTSTGFQTVVDQIKARLATPWTSPPTTYSKPPASSNLPTGSTTDQTGSGPFFERGELSELPAFGRTPAVPAVSPITTSSTTLVSGVNMATVFDRGREELFRRLIEMITTRGNVFTVYAVGQSIVPVAPADTKPRKPTSTQQVRVTFKLVPKQLDGTVFHPITDDKGSSNDLNPAAPNTRFYKPDHYDVQVLSVSSGNS